MRPYPMILFVAALVLAGGACAPIAGQTIAVDAETVRKGATAQKLTDRGEVAASIGDLARAEQYFSGALAAGGDSAFLTRRLLWVCVEDHRYRVAVDYAETHLRQHPADAGIRFVLATIYAGLSDVAEAQKQFENLVSHDVSDPDVHFAYASLLQTTSNGAESARSHLRTYLRLKPDGEKAERARAMLAASPEPDETKPTRTTSMTSEARLD